MKHLKQVLGHRLIPVAVALVGAALMSPALGSGYFLDDLIHRLIFSEGGTSGEALTRLFALFNSENLREAMATGFAPWWTAQELRLAFCRPLSAATHLLDHMLWPDSAWAMHLHSILWFAACCFLTAVLLRRLLTPGTAGLSEPRRPIRNAGWVAGLAAVFFALDDAHMLPAHWISHRNTLVAFVFGMLSLIAYERWRRNGWRPGAVWSLLFLALSLFSAESGLATAGYLVAYALFLERGVWYRRILPVLPSLLIALLWQVAYRVGEYGTKASGLYIDPGSDILRFAAVVPGNLALQILGLFGWMPIPPYVLSTAARDLLLLISAAFVLVILALVWPVLRRDSTARFFAFGLLAALLPACAIQAQDPRLLFFASVGAMGLLAQTVAFELGTERLRALSRPNLWRPAVLVLLTGIHIVWAPINLVRTAPLSTNQTFFESLIDLPDESAIGGKDAIVVNAPYPFAFTYLTAIRSIRGKAIPARVRVLAAAFSAVEIERLDDRTLSLRSEQGLLGSTGEGPADRGWPAVHWIYMSQKMVWLFRSPTLRFVPGERIELSGMTVEVTRVAEDGRLGEACFYFGEPLESAGFTWFRWNWSTSTYQPFELPQIGERIEVRGFSF